MKTLKKLTTIGLALLVAFTIVGYQEVSAEEANVIGHFYVENTTDGANATDGWKYNDIYNCIRIYDSGDYIIKKACDCEDGEVHNISIDIYGDAIDVNLTIEDVHMSKESDTSSLALPALRIKENSNVKLILVGNNSFTSPTQYAGIQFGLQVGVAVTGSLEITSYTNGTLTATGGEGGAGIGTSSKIAVDANNITISGGTIYAYGGTGAAGIGGGFGYGASNISITGGTIYAQGGTRAASIGGGQSGTASNISITGGTITAVSGADSSSYSAYVIGNGWHVTADASESVNIENVISGDAEECLTQTSTCSFVAGTSEPAEEEPSLTQVTIVDTAAK